MPRQAAERYDLQADVVDAPPNRAVRSEGLYGSLESRCAHAALRRVSLSGFTTFTPTVQALDGPLNLFVARSRCTARSSATTEPDATSVRSLDLYRMQIGFNLFHGCVKSAELHVTGGVLGLHGNEWTPAGSARADLRVGAGLLYRPGVGPLMGPRIQIGIRF